MAFDPSLSSIYYPTPLCIGDITYAVQFTGFLGEPAIQPEMEGDVNIKTYFMRQGLNQPGNRVFLHRGGAVGYRDVEWVSTVTPTQLTKLVGWFEQDPGGSSYSGFAYSPDGGTTNYDVVWQKKGLVQKNFEYNQKAFTQVTIKLHVLGIAASINLSHNTLVT